MSASRVVAAAVLVLQLLGSRPARAGDGPNERAIALAQEARSAYAQGRWADALALFRVAESIAHSPVFGLYMARCLRQLGKLVEARDQYRGITAQALDASASEPFRAAQADARRELAAIERTLPRLSVTFARPIPDVVVTVDGQRLTGAQLAEPIPVNPGAHAVRAQTGSGPAATRVVQIGARDPAHRLVLDVRTTARGSAWPGLITGGIGVAALGAGTVTGVVAIAMTNDIRRNCTGGSCPAQYEADARRANRYATASTASFIGGGVLLAAGAVLYVTRPWGRRMAASGLSLEVVPGPGTLGVSGTF